jgi:prepilin signal peptidase PulO-like enzyme (type II secretory pathway)
MPLFIASFFILGAIMASFMGVVAGRLSTGASIWTGRSRCDACNIPLSPLSLVPILSYFAMRGRAECCGARISFLAPLSEILLGALFALSYLQLGLTPALALMCIALALLLALVLYDLAHQILPPVLLYPFVAAALATSYAASAGREAFFHNALVALCIGGSLALIHVFSRGRAMGLADAPLSCGLALLTGPVALSGFVYSFWIGAVVGIGMLWLGQGSTRMDSEVPFAPFLAAGFLLAYFTQWNLLALIAALP